MVNHKMTPREQELFEEGFLEIPLKTLLQYCDPLLEDTWGCGAIQKADVEIMVGFADDYSVPSEYDQELYESYDYNVNRIAWLVEHGWPSATEDPQPIILDVGLLGYVPRHIIADGNHRVAAAKIRGDETILVSIMGDLDKARRVFHEDMDLFGDYWAE